MDFKHIGRLIILSGFFMIVSGIILLHWEKVGELLNKMPLGKLPGDIMYKNKSFSFYFPVTTCLLVSLILTLLFYLLRRR